jgi:predicted MFS family arabinose efflux permease
MEAESVAVHRGPFGYPAFRRAVLGRTVSAAGSWMQTVAAAWLVFELTHRTMALALLTACARGPAIFLSTYGGTLSDRFDRRRLAMALYTFQAVPSALLALLSWSASPTLFEIYSLTFILGAAGALASPSSQGMVIATVPRGLARSAAAMGSVSFNVARLVGPAAGGILLTLDGPALCFAVNAASFGAVVLLAASLPREAGWSSGTATSLRSALRHAEVQPFLRRIIPVVLVFSVFVGPVQELAPAISHRFGHEAHLYGFMISGLAAGGLIALPIRTLLKARGVGTRAALGGSMVLAAAALVLLAVAPNYVLGVLAMVLCGIAWDLLFIIGLSGAQLAEREVSGVMTGLFFTASVGGITVGAWLVGGLFGTIGMEWALAACALVALLGAFLALPDTGDGSPGAGARWPLRRAWRGRRRGPHAGSRP